MRLQSLDEETEDSIVGKKLIPNYYYICCYRIKEISMKKLIIYSVLTRIWGNKCQNLTPNGSLEENGCGKLADFDDAALQYIKELGCNYVWYIGLLEHSTTTAFEGIASDPKAIVKGNAGSPYAVKDYYDIAPALATKVEERQKEFDELLSRTHKARLGFIMDFIPNHLARTYCSDAKPKEIVDFGTDDDQTKTFSPNNNFYYFPKQSLHLPLEESNYQESPARATGNDCFSPYPSKNDWYETVKLNYGINYLASQEDHFNPIPDTWQKMYDVLKYWAERGVDGFRCDMVELVPPAFWSWLIPKLKADFPKLIFLAEIYQPHRYKDYLDAGFDYLYDKVGTYDTMKAIIRGEANTLAFDNSLQATEGFQNKMCYFLENHDEQRLASDFFAAKEERGYPALASLLFSSNNPFLLYFAQELGEKGMDEEGFSGLDGRTSIFDYWALDKVQRLQADKYKGSKLKDEEIKLMNQYKSLLNLANKEDIFLNGAYYGLNYAQSTTFLAKSCLTYIRYSKGAYILVVANFSEISQNLELNLPKELFTHCKIKENCPLKAEDLLRKKEYITTLTSLASYLLEIEALGVRIIKFIELEK